MQVFRKYSTSIRLGELLVQAGILTQAQVAEANRHSGAKRLQIGQIMVMYGFLNARDLQTTLDAQSAIREKLVDIQTAVRCLKIAIKTETSFQDVLREQSGLGQSQVLPDKLGQLLFEAEIISREQLSLAMQRSQSTGLPLGHMLGLDNIVNDSLLATALITQKRLRDEMITREEAIKILRENAGFTDNLESSKASPADSTEAAHAPGLAYHEPRKRGIRLGEMMVLAGLLTETEAMNALEWGLINNQLIGVVLAKKANVKQEVIDAALQLQQMVDQYKLDASEACECLTKIAATNISVERAVEEHRAKSADDKSPSLSYKQLVTLARVISAEEFEAAFDYSTKAPQVVGKLLATAGFIDGDTVRATLKCHYLLSKGLISQDDAVATLDYCLHHRPGKTIDYDAALSELGWSAQSPLKLSGEIGGSRSSASQSTTGLVSLGDVIKAPRKFTQTISPEDRSASKLYQMLSGQAEAVSTAELKEIEGTDDALLLAFTRLAQSYAEQGNYAQSQLVYERILVDRMNKLGANHLSLVSDLENLAGVLCCQGKFNQAETFMRRSVVILESNQASNEELCEVLSLLSGIYYRQEKYSEAELLTERVVRLREEKNPQSIDYADALKEQAKVLKKLGRIEQAEEIYARAEALLAKLGSLEANQSE